MPYRYFYSIIINTNKNCEIQWKYSLDDAIFCFVMLCFLLIIAIITVFISSIFTRSTIIYAGVVINNTTLL